jgi:hypothetical protein
MTLFAAFPAAPAPTDKDVTVLPDPVLMLATTSATDATLRTNGRIATRRAFVLTVRVALVPSLYSMLNVSLWFAFGVDPTTYVA